MSSIQRMIVNPRVTGWFSIIVALSCGVIGWISLGRVEIGANDSLVEVNQALVSVESSLRGSTDVAAATAEALDAAAVSLDAASDGSSATSEVATEVADVAGALPPVLETIGEGLDQVNETVVAINDVVDDLPFDLGSGTNIATLDPVLDDIDPLLSDLRDAEVSLDALATEADLVEASTGDLSADLRAVATELRSSVDDIEVLADDVADARTTLDADTDNSLDLLAAQLVIAGLVLAVILGSLPDALGPRGTS